MEKNLQYTCSVISVGKKDWSLRCRFGYGTENPRVGTKNPNYYRCLARISADSRVKVTWLETLRFVLNNMVFSLLSSNMPSECVEFNGPPNIVTKWIQILWIGLLNNMNYGRFCSRKTRLATL